jgi:anti-sigma regulatory factor (Ser/Thr protein kinase)
VPSLSPDVGQPTPSPDGEPELRLTIPATQENTTRARRRLQGWLIDIGWPLGDRPDIVLAAHEAMVNVVDHAYPADVEPGSARLHARQLLEPGRRRRRVVVVVGDDGHWQPPPSHPGHRGRGLVMIEKCMDSVQVQAGDEGTSVIMTSVPAPAATTMVTPCG